MRNDFSVTVEEAWNKWKVFPFERCWIRRSKKTKDQHFHTFFHDFHRIHKLPIFSLGSFGCYVMWKIRIFDLNYLKCHNTLSKIRSNPPNTHGYVPANVISERCIKKSFSSLASPFFCLSFCHRLIRRENFILKAD